MAKYSQAPLSAKLSALLQIEELVDGGSKVSVAVEQVSMSSGIPVRTLYRYRKLTDFVPRSRWGDAIAPRWNPSTGMKVICHPEALRSIIELCKTGVGVAESYRHVCLVAAQNGWSPIPTERTLRREVLRNVDRAEVRGSRRNAPA